MSKGIPGLSCPECGAQTRVYSTKVKNGIRSQYYRCENGECDFKKTIRISLGTLYVDELKEKIECLFDDVKAMRAIIKNL